jgi:hypothetical protein
MGKTCRRCGQPIEPGAEVMVAQGTQGSMRINPYHEACADAAEATASKQILVVSVVAIAALLLIAMVMV